MINRERVINEFVELIKIDSISRKERKMADFLKQKLEGMGYQTTEDDTAQKINGDTGNIICHVKGKDGVSPILLMAHMDTVVPGTGKKPVFEGNIIKTDGSTVLGGDDAAGIVCILEALRVLKEEKAEHGDLYIVFTVAEEVGLLGAKNLNCEGIPAKYGFIMDGEGPIGTVAVKAPSHNNISVVVKGKAAHAGIEPENGINAIQIACLAISSMKVGRIDAETTANVGIINGGRATNIICDNVEIKAEARSLNKQKLDQQTAHMKECFEQAAAKFGGSVEISIAEEYSSYDIKEDEKIIDILKKASEKSGVKLNLVSTGGGSDTNIMNAKGIKSVDISVGMKKAHTVEEEICVDDIINSAAFLVNIIKSVKEVG